MNQEELSNYIYEFNLISTQKVKNISEYCQVINEENKFEIDYTNSITILELVQIFNKEYTEFKKQYQSIPKLNFLGREVKYAFSNPGYICFFVEYPKKEYFNEEEAIVKIFEIDNKIYSNITNNLNSLDENFKNIKLILPEQIVNDYINLSKQQDKFLESYLYLKNKIIFGQINTIFATEIEGNILDKLNCFTVTLGSLSMNSETYIEIKFDLTNNLSIMYDESRVIIDNKKIEEKKEIIDKIVKESYIKNSKLPDIYQKVKSKTRTLKK